MPMGKSLHLIINQKLQHLLMVHLKHHLMIKIALSTIQLLISSVINNMINTLIKQTIINKAITLITNNIYINFLKTTRFQEGNVLKYITFKIPNTGHNITYHDINILKMDEHIGVMQFSCKSYTATYNVTMVHVSKSYINYLVNIIDYK